MSNLHRAPSIDDVRQFVGLALAYSNNDPRAWNALLRGVDPNEMARIGAGLSHVLTMYLAAFAASTRDMGGDDLMYQIERDARATLHDSISANHSLVEHVARRWLQEFALNLAGAEQA